MVEIRTRAAMPGYPMLGAEQFSSGRVVVMDYGKKIGDGTPDEVRNNQDVIDAYLGVAHD